MKELDVKNKLVIIDDTEGGNLALDKDSQLTISFTDNNGKSVFGLKLSVSLFKKHLEKILNDI